jgi:uncharacterized protein (DUF2147 family)
MIKNYLLPLFIVVFSFGLCAQNTNAPTGRWTTSDDETGEAKSIIVIYEQDGGYYGKIDKILTEGRQDVLCTECSGKQKDQPMLGLVIVKGLKKSGDFWKGGTILDPQKGAEYKLSAWFEDDPNVLFIRGKHWTGIYRTQTWKRVK